MSKSHSVGKWQRQNLDLVSLTLWTPFFLMSQASVLYILRTSWLLIDRIHFLVDRMGPSALKPCIRGTDTIINKFGLQDLSWEFQTWITQGVATCNVSVRVLQAVFPVDCANCRIHFGKLPRFVTGFVANWSVQIYILPLLMYFELCIGLDMSPIKTTTQDVHPSISSVSADVTWDKRPIIKFLCWFYPFHQTSLSVNS